MLLELLFIAQGGLTAYCGKPSALELRRRDLMPLGWDSLKGRIMWGFYMPINTVHDVMISIITSIVGGPD